MQNTTLCPNQEPTRKDVLKRCFRGERLLALPTQKQPRRYVLEALAAQFEPCMNYPEREVNALLSEAYDDFHALHTALVAERAYAALQRRLPPGLLKQNTRFFAALPGRFFYIQGDSLKHAPHKNASCRAACANDLCVDMPRPSMYNMPRLSRY